MGSIEFCVSISVDVEIQTLLDAGFENVSCDGESVVLRVPKGWTLKRTDEKSVKVFLDESGNVRGAVAYNYAYLRRRYELDTLKVSEDDFPETEKLIVTDRKTGETIMDFGSFEPYSDYEKDLHSMAKRILQMRYADWENPLAYWE